MFNIKKVVIQNGGVFVFDSEGVPFLLRKVDIPTQKKMVQTLANIVLAKSFSGISVSEEEPIREEIIGEIGLICNLLAPKLEVFDINVFNCVQTFYGTLELIPESVETDYTFEDFLKEAEGWLAR